MYILAIGTSPTNLSRWALGVLVTSEKALMWASLICVYGGSSQNHFLEWFTSCCLNTAQAYIYMSPAQHTQDLFQASDEDLLASLPYQRKCPFNQLVEMLLHVAQKYIFLLILANCLSSVLHGGEHNIYFTDKRSHPSKLILKNCLSYDKPSPTLDKCMTMSWVSTLIFHKSPCVTKTTFLPVPRSHVARSLNHRIIGGQLQDNTLP